MESTTYEAAASIEFYKCVPLFVAVTGYLLASRPRHVIAGKALPGPPDLLAGPRENVLPGRSWTSRGGRASLIPSQPEALNRRSVAPPRLWPKDPWVRPSGL
jgi:hypothetical protein